MSEAEAVVLHSVIAISEFANALEEIELGHPVEQKVLSDVQQALASLFRVELIGWPGRAVRAVEGGFG